MIAELVCVDPIRVDEMWPHVSPMIREAVVRGGLGCFADVQNDVLDGRNLLWIVWDGTAIRSAAITALITSDADKACVILACGGNGVRDWIDCIAEIEAYARAERCDRMRLFGRRGWARLLPDYKAEKVILERAL